MGRPLSLNTIINFFSSFLKKRPTVFSYLLLLVVCLLYVIVAIISIRDDTITIDEVAHIPSGYVNIIHHDFTLNPEHPPLIKIIGAIPLLFQPISYTLPKTDTISQWQEGDKFFFENGNNMDLILVQARVTVILFLGFLVFCIGIALLQLLPMVWAFLALFLITMDPNLLAHSRYVTTDAGMAYLSLLSILLTILFLKKPNWKKTIILSLTLGILLLTKFSGLLTYIFIIGSIGIILTYQQYHRKRSIFPSSLQCIFLILAPFIVIYCVYFTVSFQSHLPRLNTMLQEEFVLERKDSWMYQGIENIWSRPIFLYAIGLHHVQERSNDASENKFPQFLDGEFKTNGGWWDYFLRAYAYKETPTTLLLTLCSILCLFYMVYQKKKIPIITLYCGIFSLLYLGISMTSSLNIGIRHISPVLACLPVASVGILSSLSWKYAHKTIWIIPFIISTQLASIILISPAYLAYFNILFGGPQKGYTHLIDSNIDWGNNIKKLVLWAQKNNISKVYVDYWGRVPLSYYDHSHILQSWHVQNGLPKGYFAINPMWINHSKWMHITKNKQLDYSYLENISPIAYIDYGIYIYYLP